MLDFSIFAGTVIIGCIGATLYFYSGRSKKKTSSTTIPGPDVKDKRQGNLPDIYSAGSFHQFLMNLHEQYGDIASFSFGPTPCVSISTPELFKEQSKVFDRPAELFQAFIPIMTEACIQYANGADGKRRHAAYLRCFSGEALKRYYPALRQSAEKFVQHLTSTPKHKHINLHEEFLNFSMGTMLKISFGSYFDDEEAVANLGKSYQLAWDYVENKLIAPAKVASQESADMFEKEKENIYDILKKVLSDRENNPPPDDRKIFADVVLELGMSERAILADAVIILFGGFHTSSLWLTWCVYFLTQHPEIEEKVRTELFSVLGEEGKVTPDNVQKLVYTRQVMDETLRLTALVTYAARVSDDDVVLGGHRVAAGTPVIQALGVLHMDKTLYPNPERFNPDNFDADKVKRRPRFSFEPFGYAGKRRCMGHRFGYTETIICLSEVLRKISFQLIPGQSAPKKLHGLLTKPENDIYVTVSRQM